jgi:hypothetical protein
MILFDPETHGVKLQRGYTIQSLDQVVEDETELGSRESVAVANKAIRRLSLPYRLFDFAAREYLQGFFDFHRGAAGRFLYQMPELVPSPFLTPPVMSVAGGGQGARTITIMHTWVTTTGETLASPLATLAVPANELISIDIPVYPPAVTQTKIYAAEDNEGAEVFQTVLNGERNWTQPDAPLLTGTDSPPAANTATEVIPVKFVVDSFAPRRLAGTGYEVTLELEEAYA